MNFSSQRESQSLLNQKKSNVKWYQKLLKWPFSWILFGLLFLGALYLLYGFIKYEIQPASNDTIKKKNALHIASIATTNDEFLKKCAPIIKCDPNAKYRSANGTCNNLDIPTWGAIKTPFFRMIDANYSDGYYKLRLQTNGKKLPVPRMINLNVFLNHEIYRGDENNVLLLPFSQLLAHDISGMPIHVLREKDGSLLECCTIKNKIREYPMCELVLESPPDDPIFKINNRTCTTLYRALTSKDYDCPLYPTTYINTNSHFIDASEVYGSNESYALHLRAMDGGRLKFSVSDNGQMFCPFINNQNNRSSIENQYGSVRYDTGDPSNGNQNLGITTMQTLFLRFHNYIASKLSSLNPFWSDEIVYQESRRIIIATIQRIAFEDYLPIIIGKDFQELYGLNKPNIYDPSINPSTSQELSTAAFRVLHSMIPVQFNFMNKNYKIENSVIVTDWISHSDIMPLDDNFDKLLKGFIETPGRMVQPSYNFYLSNFLFARIDEYILKGQEVRDNFIMENPKYNSLDQLSVDILRGRDVGLQPYNQVRALCGYPLAKNFEDLEDLLHAKDIAKLKEFYDSVNDIDLIVGLLLEKHSDGAIVGPTTRCLIADSFYRYKAGDRFFYDVQGQPGSFTKDQLKVIKKITLSHVICATSNVDHVQQDIFKIIDHNLFPTIKQKCDKEFYLDFKNWDESNSRPEL